MTRARQLCTLGVLVLIGGLGSPEAVAKSVGVPSTVTLIRGGCYGPCAEYEVTIAQNGSVRWLGLDFVSFIGDTTYTVSPRRARAIVRRASRFEFAALAAHDNLCTTDMRKAAVVFRDSLGATLAYRDDHGCRSRPHARARRLERAIDRVAKTRRYQAKRSPPCVHVQDNIHYRGDDDLEVRAGTVDAPWALHRGEVLDENLAALHANPSFRIELWTIGRPSDAQRHRLDAYAAALVEGGIARERIAVEMLDGSGGSKLGALADDMMRIAVTSGTCLLKNQR